MLTFVTNGSYIDFKDNGTLFKRLDPDSRCIEWGYDETTPTKINFNVDQIGYENVDISNISFEGVACTTQADFVTGIEAMFPGYAGGGGSGVGYPTGTKIYMALLTQTGTSNPVATVGVNTLGGAVSYTYDDVGYTIISSSGLFPVGKTHVFLSLNQGSQIYSQADADTLILTFLANEWAGCIQIIVFP